MAFWSGERLLAELPQLIPSFDKNNIDCAAYRLTVGDEVYVSPTSEDPKSKFTTKTYLKRVGKSCVIPPGQFAFLLTEEEIRVPENAIGFISMRSKPKFRGLVNVSGFHVDPGYQGKLVFAVFNAGPSAVHVARGDDWFLIWYADLDQMSSYVKKPGDGLIDIRSEMINPISGEIQSLEGLSSKIKENDKKISDRLSAVERDHAVVKWATALLIGAAITIGARYYLDQSTKEPPQPASSEQSQIE